MSDGTFLDESLLAPVPGGTAAGRDLTYDASLEAVSAEIDKVTAVTGEAPDWGLVGRECERLLREASKDLRVASWWVAAVGVTEGWAGVARGAATYRAVLERFWEDMYPPLKRVRARAGLAAWLWEQLARSLVARPVAFSDGDAVREVEAAIAGVDGMLTERVGDANPGLGGLRAVLREKIRSIPDPPAQADPFLAPAERASGDAQVSVVEAAAPVPFGAAAPAIVEVSSLDAAESAADGWRMPLATLAGHARESAPTAPWPYRLARIAAWLTLEVGPPVEDGKTFVRGPKSSERARFQSMFQASAWDSLRDAAEDALTEHPLWLDLHRWSALALERSGPPFAAARESVGRETAALVARLPGLPSLLFSNGTPFASPETSDWLAEERVRFGGAVGAASTVLSPADEAPKALLAEAEGRVAAGQVDEGLAMAISLANNAASAAIRFRAQLASAQMAQRAGKGDLALALLERLLPQVDPTLEAWAPDVCARFFETALKVTRAVSPDWVERHALLFRRLLQVDPAAALRIG